MSKTFEDNALKAKVLSEGLRQHLSEVEKYGVKETDLLQLEKDVQVAIEMNQKVEALREEVSAQLQAANAALADIKERAMRYRSIIKQNFPQEQWLRFGLPDKR